MKRPTRIKWEEERKEAPETINISGGLKFNGKAAKLIWNKIIDLEKRTCSRCSKQRAVHALILELDQIKTSVSLPHLSHP